MNDSETSFRFHHQVDVRFKDVDVGGHAHHSHALVYFEEGRAAYWREVAGGGELGEVGYILAEARLRFRRRILYPERLRVGVRVSRLGRRHFEMAYEARGSDGELRISGDTVQVMYDYGRGTPRVMPARMRAAIEAFDGPFGHGGRARSAEPT